MADEFKVTIEHVIDNELKFRYVREIYFDKIDDEEILNSDVWVVAEDDNGKCFIIAMLQKKDMWDEFSEESVKITHLSLHPDLFEQSILFNFYVKLETYYVNTGINSVCISIPKIKGFTTKATKFFKKIGFLKYEEYNEHYPEGATLLVKFDLKKWYVEDGTGKYGPKVDGS